MDCWRCNEEWKPTGPEPSQSSQPNPGVPASVLLAFGAGQFVAKDGHPVHGGTWNSIPGFPQLAAGSTAARSPPAVTTHNVQMLPNVFWGGKCPEEEHCSGKYSIPGLTHKDLGNSSYSTWGFLRHPVTQSLFKKQKAPIICHNSWHVTTTSWEVSTWFCGKLSWWNYFCFGKGSPSNFLYRNTS